MENQMLLNRKQAAEYLTISPGTLANWHSTGAQKIPMIKIGRLCRYREKNLDHWLEQQIVDKSFEDS